MSTEYYKYIQNLDAGTWFDPKLSYLRPPTLKEFLDLCSKKRYWGYYRA